MPALREGLSNRVGLALLAASILVAAAVSLLPPLGSYAAAAPLVAGIGVAAYALTVLVYLLTAPIDPSARHPAMARLLDTRRQMADRLAELRAAGASRESALVPVVADALRHMDTDLVPTFRSIVVRHESLRNHLALYGSGKLVSPDQENLERLRLIYNRQEEAIGGCVKQAANAYATLIAVIQSADEAGVLEQARLWATDLGDIYDGLSEILSGIDPYEQAIMQMRLDAGTRETVKPLIREALRRVEPTAAAPPAPERAARASAPTYPDGLTHREAEVLALLADGLSSKEIGDRLVITLATVSRHIANLYGKTGSRGRADATRYALRHGITSSALFAPDDGRGAAGFPGSRAPTEPQPRGGASA